jgi:hypothetical protein
VKLTERYIALCRELADAGYVWEPRPGDWMLDLNDESVGMLTTFIENAALLRANNTQIPYGSQIADMLAARGVMMARDGDTKGAAGDAVWRDRAGREVYRCAAAALDENEDEESLAALVAAMRTERAR